MYGAALSAPFSQVPTELMISHKKFIGLSPIRNGYVNPKCQWPDDEFFDF